VDVQTKQYKNLTQLPYAQFLYGGLGIGDFAPHAIINNGKTFLILLGNRESFPTSSAQLIQIDIGTGNVISNITINLNEKPVIMFTWDQLNSRVIALSIVANTTTLIGYELVELTPQTGQLTPISKTPFASSCQNTFSQCLVADAVGDTQSRQFFTYLHSFQGYQNIEQIFVGSLDTGEIIKQYNISSEVGYLQILYQLQYFTKKIKCCSGLWEIYYNKNWSLLM